MDGRPRATIVKPSPRPRTFHPVPQHVLFSYFELPRARDKFFALANMGRGVERFGRPAGMEWLKLLGSGGGPGGFGLWPNWGGYALLAAFPTRVLAEAALDAPLWRAYAEHSDLAGDAAHPGTRHLLLRPLQVHGRWDGAEPFRTGGDYDRDAPVAVLTRARIRARHLPAFWSRVARVSESAREYPERAFSVGVGELPVVQQATVSLWTSGRAMEAYAYRSRYHAEVVRLTRQRGWYSEELFCRFAVVGR